MSEYIWEGSMGCLKPFYTSIIIYKEKSHMVLEIKIQNYLDIFIAQNDLLHFSIFTPVRHVLSSYLSHIDLSFLLSVICLVPSLLK